MTKRQVDAHAVRELSLFVDNDYPSYQHKNAAFENLAKHACRGVFDRAKAAKLMQNVTSAAGTRYMAEFGTSKNFDVNVRKAAAVELVNEFVAAFNDAKRGKTQDLPAKAMTLIKNAKCKIGTLSGVRRKKRK